MVNTNIVGTSILLAEMPFLLFFCNGFPLSFYSENFTSNFIVTYNSNKTKRFLHFWCKFVNRFLEVFRNFLKNFEK